MSNNNNHKMKGLLKGLRYISQIFDEEKEQEMKIGLPTDVKHVAHIGWDGPSVDSSPSWMKDFKAPGEFQSAPLNGTGDPLDKPEIKWVSEDSNRRSTRSEGESAKDRDLPDVPKSRRRASSENIDVESLGKEGSTKSRQSRKSKEKESSKSSRQLQQEDSGAAAPESPSKKLPDIPKKTRRKKSKESESGGSTRPSRSKETESGGSTRSSRSKETESGGSTRSSRSKETENGGSTRSSRSKNTDGSTIASPSRTSTLADPSDLEIGSNNSKELTPPFVEELREGK